MRTLAAVIALSVLVPTAALAEERATSKDAERLVHKAVSFVRQEGKDKAFAVFNDPRGAFTDRDLYVFVIDFTGLMLAHGAKPELIGKNEWARKDPRGKLFVQAMVKVAQQKGSGWEEYLFENPLTGRVEQKVAYFEKVDDYLVGCGAFVH